MFGRKAKKIKNLEIDLRASKETSAKYWEWFKEASALRSEYYDKVVKEKDSINKSLADENRDLVRQLELYKAVLAQLQIPIKLPGKKA